MIKPVTVATVLVAAPVAALTACTSNQPSNNQPSASSSVSSTSASPAPGAQTLTTQLKTADGTPVANATFEFANGYATLTVETIANHILTPGFHGMHIHAVGKCEANSVAPTGGPPGNFLSAGGHYQVPGHTSHPASGDLTSLEVRSDGGAKLVTTTDAFTASDLLAGDKTALMIHQDSDNFGNIPADRYTQKNGAPGPDQETLDTGDAGKRVACGVIGSATAVGTTTTGAATSAATTSTATQTPTGTTTTTASVTVTSPPTVTSPGVTSATPSSATSSPAVPGGG
jgi:Cu-Zn family superoxide dismutase